MKSRDIQSQGECFVVGADLDKTGFEVEIGPCQAAIDKINERFPDMVQHIFPLDLVARRLRKFANDAGLTPKLPKPLTPYAFGTDEYKKWIADIKNYRQVAATLRNTRKKKVRA